MWRVDLQRPSEYVSKTWPCAGGVIITIIDKALGSIWTSKCFRKRKRKRKLPVM
jgi:hypothetical protein